MRYAFSFRRHNGFHEQCVERIFNDLLRFCQPEKMSVYALYPSWRSGRYQPVAQ
ncbi:hypothetical protein ACLK2I_15415 [Escherichia coli]